MHILCIEGRMKCISFGLYWSLAAYRLFVASRAFPYLVEWFAAFGLVVKKIHHWWVKNITMRYFVPGSISTKC